MESVNELEPPVTAPIVMSPVVSLAFVLIVVALAKVTAPSTTASLDDAMVPLRVTVPPTLVVVKPPL